jgi:hypothetical protein
LFVPVNDEMTIPVQVHQTHPTQACNSMP